MRSRNSSPLPLVVKLNNSVAVDDAMVITANIARQGARRQLHRRRLAPGGRLQPRGAPAARTSTAGNGNEGRYHEGRAPACIFDEVAGDHGSHRHAQVARKAVDADGQAGPLAVPHQHRNAHRVIDGGKCAEQRKRRRQLPRVLHARRNQCRDADAEEEHQHHPPPSPVITELARRQRAEAEQREGPGTIGHQVFPATDAEICGNAAYRRRKDQQEKVVQCVRDIEQQRRRTRGPVRGNGSVCAHRESGLSSVGSG